MEIDGSRFAMFFVLEWKFMVETEAYFSFQRKSEFTP
jgi:hypothetical protein